jgi:hypothetical protein
MDYPQTRVVDYSQYQPVNILWSVLSQSTDPSHGLPTDQGVVDSTLSNTKSAY